MSQQPTAKQVYEGLVAAGMVAPGQTFERLGSVVDEKEEEEEQDEYFEIPIHPKQIKGRTTADGPRSQFIAKLQVSNGDVMLRVDDGSNLPFWLEIRLTPAVMAKLDCRTKPQL